MRPLVNSVDLNWVAEVCEAKSAVRLGRVQSLWSGYGEIVRVALEGECRARESVIVKSVTPPERPADDVSHARKCRSYDVEHAFYEHYASRCDDTCRVPRLLGSSKGERRWLFVLEDLDASGFSQRRQSGASATLRACASWLASFHARFMGEPPVGLWEEGTYWHLATRQGELARITDPKLRALAPELDKKLASCTHRTILHGDAKLANFAFASSGLVAAVDFQYAGGGCGMKDVAYLISGETDEERLLAHYFDALSRELGARGMDPAPIVAEWRTVYPVACADFQRFLAGWQRGDDAGA